MGINSNPIGAAQTDRTDDILKTFQAEAAETSSEVSQETAESKAEGLVDNLQNAATLKASKETSKKSLKEKAKAVNDLLKTLKAMKIPKEKIKEQAKEYAKKNPELKEKSLILLREKLKQGASEEEVEKILESFFSDPTIQDEAFDFLLDTTVGQLSKTVKDAKDLLNEKKGREIRAGRNIANEVQIAAKETSADNNSVRDLYRKYTDPDNQKASTDSFLELSEKYSYKDLSKVIKFLFHSLGADLKSKGPSIPPGELHNLMTQTKNLQAIMGIYRFFEKRMSLLTKQFNENDISIPKGLTFESISKSFVVLANDRYPSSDKVMSQLGQLYNGAFLVAKIIIGSQLRDGVKEVAVNQVYRSIQHRDELLNAIIECLEDLEDLIEETIKQDEMEELNEA